MGEIFMTDNEIVKALEYCSEYDGCYKCPFQSGCGDLSILTTNALELINRQKAEIERYLHSIKLLENDVKTSKEEAVREFGHFLIDEAKGGKVHTIDIPDYVQEFLSKGQ